MKIILENDGTILNEIELTTLQVKALKLMSPEPIEFLARKIERILEFTVEQAKQRYTEYKMPTLTDAEILVVLDKMTPKEPT